MTIENCSRCGGTHFGSHECPYTLAPCMICGEQTIWACSDCAIETSKRVHICQKTSCRDEHERRNPQHPQTCTESSTAGAGELTGGKIVGDQRAVRRGSAR